MASRLVTLVRFGLCGVVWTIIAAVFAGSPASAQTIDFRLLASENGQSTLLMNGATLPFLTTVGTTVTATVVATYIGSSQATISQTPLYTGSTEFTVMSTLTALPEVFNPGDTFTLTITFTPTIANQANGVVTVNYTELGSTGMPVQNSIVINLVGTAPSFTLGYILETTKNFVSISSGGTVPFGPTQINTTASADLRDYQLGKWRRCNHQHYFNASYIPVSGVGDTPASRGTALPKYFDAACDVQPYGGEKRYRVNSNHVSGRCHRNG